MTCIDKIKQSLLPEFSLFEQEFYKVYASENQLLRSVLEHLSKGKGKQIRPMLVLLSAKLCGAVNDSTINSAISLELLHTASLIHDDIVDESFERRGLPSVNALWNNKVAVLAGDFVLSNALNIAVKTKNLRILEIISDLGKSLADGELLQLSNTKKLLQSEADYYTIIRKKTALLFSVCTEAGTISANGNQAQISQMKQFGELLGMCFQIQDDIFDYSNDVNIGKPVGNDIREGKITLPLILALRKNNDDEIRSIVEKKQFSTVNVDKILDFVRKNEGIELARKAMEQFKLRAIDTLQDFASSDIKSALLDILDFTTKRNK